jgi:hypothetical protein
MTDDDDLTPRAASEIPEWELEEMVRESLNGWRPDIRERLNAWLDERIAAHRAVNGKLQ